MYIGSVRIVKNWIGVSAATEWMVNPFVFVVIQAGHVIVKIQGVKKSQPAIIVGVDLGMIVCVEIIMNNAWQKFLLWFDKEKPNILDSEEILKEYRRFLKSHVTSQVDIVQNVNTIYDEFAPWSCKCGSMKILETLSNNDGMFSLEYMANEEYYYPYINDNLQMISMHCAKCNYTLNADEEMRVIHNMGDE